jgi:ABC-type lipoprotein release transport system permease subunit
LASLLFQVDPIDPLTLGASVLLVVVVALAATYVPARGACVLSLMAALRYE